MNKIFVLILFIQIYINEFNINLIDIFSVYAYDVNNWNIESAQDNFGINLTNHKLTKQFSKRATRQGGFNSFRNDNSNCAYSKYRTADGSCNNLRNLNWGKSSTPYNRLLQPAYGDGLDKPRRAVSGRELPSARQISILAAPERDVPSKYLTVYVVHWGQIMSHDMTFASINGIGMNCCQNQTKSTFEELSCHTIPIPADDYFYSQFNRSCMNFVRTVASVAGTRESVHREQLNEITPLMDGSMIYGSTLDRSNHLRTFRRGRLRDLNLNGARFLPLDIQDRSLDCVLPFERCFVSGDDRVNMQPGITGLHNLYVREHNRIATTLLKLNPSWTDETVFQETRRIVVAQIQHITYNEWIPRILGRSVMESFNILPNNYGFTYNYDPNLNPNIINSFATAANRLHTLIAGIFSLRNENGTVEELELKDLFNNPESFYRRGTVDGYINSFTSRPMHSFDKYFTREITNHVFENRNFGFGSDLISIDIQRGRDHGLPGYNEYRKWCGLEPVRSFRQLDFIMSPGSTQVFANLYEHVDDIDLFIAGNHEKHLPGANVGPIFACIMGEQYRRTKLGDRFWYENGNMRHSFSEAQLHEIRKSSFARLICDNSDGIREIQPLVFIMPIKKNKIMSCKRIKKINLNLWKGERI